MQNFFYSALAGVFMCAGTLLSLLLVSDVSGAGVQYLMSGLGLTIGLLLVILTNSILCTEANIFVPANFYNASITQSCLRLFRFWLISWVGDGKNALLFRKVTRISVICRRVRTSGKGFPNRSSSSSSIWRTASMGLP